MSCDSTYTVDGVTYECAGISCPISEWLGIEDRDHKAWALDIEWSDSEADR